MGAVCDRQTDGFRWPAISVRSKAICAGESYTAWHYGPASNRQNTWNDEQNKTAVRVNPVNNYRLFRRQDLQKFLDSVAKPVTRKPR